MKVTLDFESASAVSLKAAGASRYWEHPTTEILCLCWRDDTGCRGEWWPGWGHTDALMSRVNDPGCMFEAHGTWFEINGWRQQMVELYGWPDIPNVRWLDSMAVCAYKALPLKLDHVAKVLGLHTQKDMEGHRFTLAMSRPKRKGVLDRSETSLRRVTNYCATDVDAEVEASKILGPLPRAERMVWLLDLEINQRGVFIDKPFVQAAQKIVGDVSRPLVAEFEKITGGILPTQVKALLPWVQAQGVKLPNLQKATLAAALGVKLDDEEDDDDAAVGEGDDNYPGGLGDSGGTVGPLPEHVARALTIRSIVGSAAVKKLPSMLACVNADGRARGLLQYHAASTGRWGGRLIQPQNMPRGVVMFDAGTPDEKAPPVDVMVQAIMTGDADYVQMVLGNPIDVVLSGLRHALVAAPGRVFTAGDFAGIEARVVLALAGQHDKTALMASGADVYLDVADLIFRREITKAMTAERQVGKNTVLGCGFQMAWAKFQARYAKDRDEEFCREVIRTYREDWAPKVPQLWYGLEAAALKAVRTSRPCEYAGVEYQREGEFLSARLPSGRKLWYFRPSLCEGRFGQEAWSYWAKKNGKWLNIQAYGGLLTENVVQALARDLLVVAMFKCRNEGMPIVLTVHDEILVEAEPGLVPGPLLAQIMEDRPRWAEEIQIPVKSAWWVGDRYRK